MDDFKAMANFFFNLLSNKKSLSTISATAISKSSVKTEKVYKSQKNHGSVFPRINTSNCIPRAKTILIVRPTNKYRYEGVVTFIMALEPRRSKIIIKLFTTKSKYVRSYIENQSKK
tara:strand:+ start:397 stop:744 length:348 start_codon:yes stop_codon:yes gene_type:complete